MGAKVVGVEDKDTGWKELFKRLKEIKGAYANVGVLDKGRGAATVPGTPYTKAQIASVLEFGTAPGTVPAIPPRSAIRSTFDEKKDELKKLSGELIKLVIDGKLTVKKAMDALGARLANDIKLHIRNGDPNWQPNADSTIAAKGSSKPWIDTGATLNAVTWESHVGGEGKKEE